jgi:hypothetical protein
VRHGDPWPTEWLREHPGAVRIPATFVPHPPDPAEQAARLWAPSKNPSSFAPVRRAGVWPVDRQGRPWPKTVFGAPERPLSELPQGMRAPGEAMPPEERAARDFDIRTFDPIGAFLAIKPVLDDPARAAGISPSTPEVRNGSPLLMQVQAIEPEEESRRLLEEFTDPTAELRIAQYNTAISTLRQLDPNNPQLSSLAGPGWVPSNETIAIINAEVAKVTTQRVTSFVMPGGTPIGVAGEGRDIRIVPGGATAAQEAFNYLSLAGKNETPPGYTGTLIRLPGNAGYVGLRSSRTGPAVDVNVLGVPYRTLHY